jgi:hypothetical protein
VEVIAGQIWRDAKDYGRPNFYRVLDVPAPTKGKFTCRMGLTEKADQFTVIVRKGAFKDGTLILHKDATATGPNQ